MAKLYLDPNEFFELSNNVTVFGSSGSETILINGSPNVQMDANIERVELSQNVLDYQFQVTGTRIVISLGGNPVATFSSLNTETQIVFADGMAALNLNGINIANLGGTAIPTTSGTVDPVSFDTTDISDVADPIDPNPAFSVTGLSSVEEGSNAAFIVSLANRSAGQEYSVTVTLAGSGGAVAGTDFANALTLDANSVAAGITYAANVLTIPAGTDLTRATLTTTVDEDDLSPETGEGMTVTLSSASGDATVNAARSSATTSITDVPAGPVQTAVTMAQLQGYSEAAPFDSGTDDFCFYLDAGTTLETAVTDFDAGDTLRFENAPTGAGDFNVDQAAFDDGEALIEVSNLTLTLLGLNNDYFYNSDTFINIFGQDALNFV